jgi:hypothetical protein
VSNFGLLRVRKLRAFLMNVGLTSFFGEGGLMPVGVTVLEGGLLGRRENGRLSSGVDLGEDVACCTISIGFEKGARAGEGAIAGANGLKKSVTCVITSSG